MIDPASALAAPTRTVTTSWNPDDVVRYHLALGAGGCGELADLRYVDEQQVRPLPTFSVVGAGDAATPLVYGDPLGLAPARVLQRSQSLEMHRALPADAEQYRHAARVESVWDGGTDATVVIRVDTTDDSGSPLCVNRFSLLVRGGGGFGGDPAPRATASDASEPPFVVIETRTLRQQALLYRACADRHRIHLDPAVAKAAGFERPLLQGLCTWGIACKQLVDHLLDGDSSVIGEFGARFAGPVYPGETLRITAWSVDEGFRFAAEVVERETPALRDGRLVLRQPVPSSERARRDRSGR